MFLFCIILFEQTESKYDDTFLLEITCKSKEVLQIFRMIRPTYLLYDEKLEENGKKVVYSCIKRPQLIARYLKPFLYGLKKAVCSYRNDCPQLYIINGFEKEGKIYYPNLMNTYCIYKTECKSENGFPRWEIKVKQDNSTTKSCHLILLTNYYNELRFNQRMYMRENTKRLKSGKVSKIMEVKKPVPTISNEMVVVSISCILVQTLCYLYSIAITSIDKFKPKEPSATRTQSEPISMSLVTDIGEDDSIG